MDLHIGGRIALITGAAGAIACATARILLGEGCRLILTDVDGDGLAAAAAELAGGEEVRTVVADLGRRDGADKIAAEGVRGDASWQPDMLLHAAGTSGAKGDPLADLGEEDWSSVWNVDFMSGVRVASVFIPAMRAAGWGRVVFVSSENAAQPYPDEAPYDVAKAAMLSYAKSLSQVCAQQGVLVNCVAPAFIATDMTDHMMDQRSEQLDTDMGGAISSFLAEKRPHLALKRRGRPDEVGFIIACLLSARASFVNGANYRIDGGSVQALNI